MKGNRRKAEHLLIATGVLFFAWLVVLPWLGATPWAAEHIRIMKEKRIHPDAMFYTELE